MTAAGAAALGHADWLRARHAAGALSNPLEDSGGLLRIAATHNRADVVQLLLDLGFDPDERVHVPPKARSRRCRGAWRCSTVFRRENTGWPRCFFNMAPIRTPSSLRVAIPCSPPTPTKTGRCSRCWSGMAAFRRLRRQGFSGRPNWLGRCWQVRCGIGWTVSAARPLAEQLLWGAACGGDPEIVRMALKRVDWPRDDPRWFTVLEQPLRTWTHGPSGDDLPRDTYLACFRLVLERCDPNVRGRPTDEQQFGLTTLHNIVARGDMTPAERVAFATAILSKGARLDMRDNLLKSTPLGWACRWGHLPLVKLFLNSNADPIEADAEPWATPIAWAKTKGHVDIQAYLRERGAL